MSLVPGARGPVIVKQVIKRQDDAWTDVHGLSPYSGLHRALDTEALWTSQLVASGQCLISRGDCGGLPGQRSEGTISFLCRGR